MHSIYAYYCGAQSLLALLSVMKLPHVSDIFLDNPYSEKRTSHASIKVSADKPSVFLRCGRCCDNLQCKDISYYTGKACHTNDFPWLAQYLMVNDSLWAEFAEKQDMKNSFNSIFNMHILVYQLNIHALVTFFS